MPRGVQTIPIRRMPLRVCVYRLLEGDAYTVSTKAVYRDGKRITVPVGKNRKRPVLVGHKNRFELQDLYDRCRTVWRERIAKLHPDRRGGDGRECAKLNELWQRICVLMRRKGVEVA